MAADLVELRMNVAALKRVDPYIKDILGTATQVAVYTFSALKNEWEKTGIEGALFVYSRNGEPYNSILIMNRLNTNNLVEPIVKELDWQMQAPFLLYRNSRNNIYGVWFYNRDECVKITYLLENIMESLSNKQESAKVKPTNAGADIFSMLTKAQEDYNKTPNKNDSTQPQTSTPRAPDVTSQSVMDFFAKASTTKTTHHTPVRVPTGESEPLQPLLHRLMTNPVHTVEHIEKQQRAVTPQDQNQTSVLLRNKPNQTKPEAQQNRNSCGFNVPSISPAVREPVQPILPQPAPLAVDRAQPLLENGLSFMRISPTMSSPRTSFLLQQHPAAEDEVRIVSPPLPMMLETPQKPALMPPIMFTASATKEKPEIKPEFSPDQLEPLTSKQMVQAFHYLLKNDPEFVTKLHEAYVKSFTELVS